MLIVTGAVTASADHFEALRQASLDHVHRSRAEPGCLSHAVHIDAENPLRLVFFEEWTDREALGVHFRHPDSLAFMKTVRTLAAGSTPMKIYEAAIATRS
jgi:quinol monooxygenase YgiN